MTVLSAARGRGHADTAARRRTWITRPGTYLVILLVVAITLVPMLYLILSGFRTTGQLGSNPNGLPHPWGVEQLRDDPHVRGLLAGGPEQRGYRGGGDRAGHGARLDGRLRAIPVYLPRTRGIVPPVHGRAAVPAQHRGPAAVPATAEDRHERQPVRGGAARGGVLTAGHDRHPAPVHAGDPRGTGGRGDRGRCDQDAVLRADPAPALPARPDHRGDAGLRHELEHLPAAADRAQHAVALHPAAVGGHVPVAVQHGHRESLRLYRTVHAPRPVHLRLRAALPRRWPSRCDQRLSARARCAPRTFLSTRGTPTRTAMPRAPLWPLTRSSHPGTRARLPLLQACPARHPMRGAGGGEPE